MSRIFTSTILFNKTAETLGGATFMEQRQIIKDNHMLNQVESYAKQMNR